MGLANEIVSRYIAIRITVSRYGSRYHDKYHDTYRKILIALVLDLEVNSSVFLTIKNKYEELYLCYK